MNPSAVIAGPTAWRRIFLGHLIFLWSGLGTSRLVTLINYRSPRLNPILK